MGKLLTYIIMDRKKIMDWMHWTKYWFAICYPWQQKIHKLLAIFFLFSFLWRSIVICISFFSARQNVKDILIDNHKRKKQQKESDISKSIEKLKLLIKCLRISEKINLTFMAMALRKLRSNYSQMIQILLRVNYYKVCFTTWTLT